MDPGFGSQAYTPPFAGVHGAYMLYTDVVFNGTRVRNNESVLENIKPLEIGKIYALSFYKKISWTFPELSSAPPDLYNIYLIHCSDAQSLYNPGLDLLSNPPANSQ